VSIRAQTSIAVRVPASSAVFFGGGVILPIPMRGQLADYWCWAACVEMVLAWRTTSPPSQCTLAAAQFGLTCCSPARPVGCDRGLSASAITELWRHYGSPVVAIGSSIDVVAVVMELDQDRPVQIGVTRGGSGHVVLVCGADPLRDRFTILDPLPVGGGSISVVSTNELATGLGQGDWTHTWTGI
jgi:hypothetical protein